MAFPEQPDAGLHGGVQFRRGLSAGRRTLRDGLVLQGKPSHDSLARQHRPQNHRRVFRVGVAGFPKDLKDLKDLNDASGV